MRDSEGLSEGKRSVDDSIRVLDFARYASSVPDSVGHGSLLVPKEDRQPEARRIFERHWFLSVYLAAYVFRSC